MKTMNSNGMYFYHYYQETFYGTAREMHAYTDKELKKQWIDSIDFEELDFFDENNRCNWLLTFNTI